MPFSSDTSPEARRVVLDALRRLTPQERFAKTREMTRFLAQLTEAGIARDFPDATDLQRHQEFLRRWLGRDLAERVIAHRWPRQQATPGQEP